MGANVVVALCRERRAFSWIWQGSNLPVAQCHVHQSCIQPRLFPFLGTHESHLRTTTTFPSYSSFYGPLCCENFHIPLTSACAWHQSSSVVLSLLLCATSHQGPAEDIYLRRQPRILSRIQQYDVGHSLSCPQCGKPLRTLSTPQCLHSKHQSIVARGSTSLIPTALLPMDSPTSHVLVPRYPVPTSCMPDLYGIDEISFDSY